MVLINLWDPSRACFPIYVITGILDYIIAWDLANTHISVICSFLDDKMGIWGLSVLLNAAHPTHLTSQTHTHTHTR